MTNREAGHSWPAAVTSMLLAALSAGPVTPAHGQAHHHTLAELLQPNAQRAVGRLLTHPIGPLTGGDGVNVAAADWDDDGDADLFTGSRCGDLLYFENIGQPKRPLFAPASVMTADGDGPGSEGGAELAPAAADLDGDGVLDLLVTVGREVYVYPGSRTVAASGTPLQTSTGPLLIPEEGAAAPAHLNDDRLLDLLIGTRSGRVLLALNEGTPTAPKFAAPRPLTQGETPVTVRGRARPCVWADQAGSHIAIGGDGGTLLLLDLTVSEKPLAVASSKLTVHPDALADLADESLSPAAADIDGDGRTDLMLGTDAGFVATLIQGADGSFGSGERLQQRNAPIDVGSFAAPVLADWTGDGLPDLIIGDDAGTIRVFPRLSTGEADLAFGPGRPLMSDGQPIRLNKEPLDRPYEYAQPLVVDWDGDGDPDLLAGGNDGLIQFFCNVSRGESDWPKLSLPERLMAGRELIRQAGPVSMCAGDRNLDGDPDLFVGSGAHIHLAEGLVPRVRNGGIVYYENIAISPRQQPRFFKGTRLETRTPVTWPAPALEDVSPLDVGIIGITDWDGDGRRDFIISGALGNVYVCTSPTREGAYPRLYLAADPARAPGGKILDRAYACSLADVNGDGREDILAGSARYGFVRWFDRESLPTPVYRQPKFSAPGQCTAIDLSRPLSRGGTITSWRIAIGDDNEHIQYRLKIFRPDDRRMLLVGESQWRRVEPGWNAFSCRIPGVQEGDLVGFASEAHPGRTVVVAASGGAGLCRSGEEVRNDTLLTSWGRIEVRLAIEATVQ